MKRYLCNTCLLVNDNPFDHEIFCQALNDFSPETNCCVAGSGREALTMIYDEHIRPDIIFIETELQGIDAIEFLKILRSDIIYRNVPVIVHNCSPDESRIEKIKKAGATAIYTREYAYGGIINTFFIYHLPELILLQFN